MKTIPNVQTALPGLHAGDAPKTYADLLRIALDFSPQGFTAEMMRKRLRVEKAIEGVKAGDEIKLEDADYETAKEAVKSIIWAERKPEFLAFSEAFGV